MDTLELVNAAREILRQNLPVSALYALYAAASPCASLLHIVQSVQHSLRLSPLCSSHYLK